MVAAASAGHEGVSPPSARPPVPGRGCNPPIPPPRPNSRRPPLRLLRRPLPGPLPGPADALRGLGPVRAIGEAPKVFRAGRIVGRAGLMTPAVSDSAAHLPGEPVRFADRHVGRHREVHARVDHVRSDVFRTHIVDAEDAWYRA